MKAQVDYTFAYRGCIDQVTEEAFHAILKK